MPLTNLTLAAIEAMEIANLQSEEYGSRFLFFLVGSRSMDDGSRVYMSMVYNELRWHSHMVNYCSFIPFVGLKLEVNSLYLTGGYSQALLSLMLPGAHVAEIDRAIVSDDI